MHLSSPLGPPPAASRYSALGDSPPAVAGYLLTHPLGVLRQYVLAPDRLDYLRKLLAPTGYLALLSPWTLLIAAPELAINLLSSDPQMYSGSYQYNAAIVPVLIVTAIESAALLASFAVWLRAYAQAQPWSRSVVARMSSFVHHGASAAASFIPSPLGRRGVEGEDRAAAGGDPLPRVVLAVAVLFALGMGLRATRIHGLTPLTRGFHWPEVTAHDTLGDEVLQMIPPQASVSAQSDLVPHLSQRRYIYLFPDHAGTADYVALDVTAAIFPLETTPDAYLAQVRRLLNSGAYQILAARDGYLVLARAPSTATPPPASGATTLPSTFYTFTRAAQAPTHVLNIRFGSSLTLVGYDLQPAERADLSLAPLQITTYWRATGPPAHSATPRLVLLPPGGQPAFVTDLPTIEWLPPAQWPTGTPMLVATRPLIPLTGAGVLNIGVQVSDVKGASVAPVPATLPVPMTAGAPYPSLDPETGAVVFASIAVVP